MTQFSSGKYEALTADPQPFVGLSGNRYSAEAARGLDVVYDPRRDWKYGRPLTNTENPILRRLRGAVDAPDLWWYVAALTKYEETGREPESYVLRRLIAGYVLHPQHPYIRHARRVLERLTRLEKNS